MAGERDAERRGPGNSQARGGSLPGLLSAAARDTPRSGSRVKQETTTYDRALHLLGFRARSVFELRRKLLQKGEPADEVERVIARLLDQRLLDDTEFARQFARSRVAGTGSSRFRILQELRRKGVSRALAEEAVDGLLERDGIDASAAIQRVAEKKWNALATLDAFTRRRRLYAFLARRGFNPDEIRNAMNALAEHREA